MSDQPDLFDSLPAPSGPKIPEPTEEEIAASIDRTLNDDGLDLPRDYVRDMLAGRDPTDPATHRCARTCGDCANIKPTKYRIQEGFRFFCLASYRDARRDDPACDTHFELRIGPCENCGPICDVYPCPNADPKGSDEIAAKAAKE